MVFSYDGLCIKYDCTNLRRKKSPEKHEVILFSERTAQGDDKSPRKKK